MSIVETGLLNSQREKTWVIFNFLCSGLINTLAVYMKLSFRVMDSGV